MPAIAAPVQIPAPWGGMNTRDGGTSLQPNEARRLVNWDCEGNSVVPRKGYTVWSSGASSSIGVKTLASYAGTSADYMIGVNGGRVWDFSSATAIELYDGMFASDRFQTEMYNDRLIAVNGVDTPWSFDGTTVAAAGFTYSGLTASDLVNVRKVRNRLWFCRNDTADVYYGGIEAVTGALSVFQLSQVVGGGYLMAVGAHSQDAGAGPDDYTAFIMSTGEVVLYSGDPSITFTKVGNYYMPPPVGRQCLINIGGPLSVITEIGLVPIQAAVQGQAFNVFSLGTYGKLGPTLTKDASLYKAHEGWHAVYHQGKAIINVPVVDDEESEQRVYNALTGAWTTWRDFPAAAMCVHGSDLYHGSWTDGVVYKRGGFLDNGNNIDVEARCAFVDSPSGRRIIAKAIRFDILLEGSISARYGLDANGIEGDISAFPLVDIASSTATTPWGSPWGSDWSDSSQYPTAWQSVHGSGQNLAVALEGTVSVATSLLWSDTHLLLKQAGIK